MEQNPNDEQKATLEDLEAPVRELTEEEAAQVEGGVSTAGGGAWKTKNGGQTDYLTVKLSDVLISG